MELYHWTFTAALVLLGLELLVPAFFFAGLAVGVACVGVVHFFTGDLHLARDLVLLAVTSAGAFVGMRRYFRSSKDVDISTSDVNRY